METFEKLSIPGHPNYGVAEDWEYNRDQTIHELRSAGIPFRFHGQREAYAVLLADGWAILLGTTWSFRLKGEKRLEEVVRITERLEQKVDTILAKTSFYRRAEYWHFTPPNAQLPRFAALVEQGVLEKDPKFSGFRIHTFRNLETVAKFLKKNQLAFM